MLREALGVPLQGDRWWKKLLLGGGCLVISFGIVPLWVLLGYLIRFTDGLVEDSDEIPPSFEYWGLLMSRGLGAFGICVFYLFVPTVVLLVGVFVLLIAPVNNSVSPAQARLPLTVAAAIYPFALYALPAALLHYAAVDKFRAGFSVGQLRRLWFSWAYARSWLVAAILVVVLHLLSIPVALTAIGVLAVPSLLFYSYVVATYVIASETRETLRELSDDALPSETRPDARR
jgi:hypothetical protein